WLLLLGLLFDGCRKSGPELAPVSGHVTLNGQPLENADIVFQPDNGKSPAVARTDAEGRYELAYKRGVVGCPVGQNTVRIRVSKEVVRNPPHIAARFNSKSELHREIKAGQNNFDFDVTTEGK
ncbi:MAG TPA: carboxypeptidase-like regulatory domain-containing protein, partial [Lacipirellulaceae bacterium]|nr:carboxypeptidase-like regulatory domain-containing protein [Lacipirellulaceae bacterium]